MEKKHLFLEFFFHSAKLWIVWNWFIPKIILEIFVQRQFKLASNQTECYRLEQLSVIKFSVAEKLSVKYIEKCAMCTNKHVLVKKIFINSLNGFAIMSLCQKIVHGVETNRLSGKEKVPSSVVSKESHTESLLG